jgi:nucleoside-diphosphate-sugar epimerase
VKDGGAPATGQSSLAPPRWLVSGSSGFIGTRLCRTLAASRRPGQLLVGLDKVPAADPAGMQEIVGDIRDRPALMATLAGLRPEVLIHLAAVAEAVIPFDGLEELFGTNLGGTVNLLEAACPQRVVFTSSSSVYGNCAEEGVAEDWRNVNPLGGYAGTKMIGELTCRSWARALGTTAVCLRLGNVIGPGCHGLIGYLVNHAVTHPDGRVAAQLRGEGRIYRDYVSLAHVIDAVRAACEVPCAAGGHLVYNVSAGVRLANGFIAEIVTATLARAGFVLRADYANPIAAEEPLLTALDVSRATAALGLKPPTRDAIVQAIEEAVLDLLHTRNGSGGGSTR